MAHSGDYALKSFSAFTCNDGLLERVVEAIKAGEKTARTSGDIQTFEAFAKGFRQNIILGRVMVIPAKVADSRETFPIALLYGTLLRQFSGEEMADLINFRIGDTEFDEYSKADLAELKDRIFKTPEGKYESLVLFAPAWWNRREYISFKFTKDNEQLRNMVRHLIFGAYFDPRLSSAFNALMTDMATDKLDVTNITPKLPFPGVAINPLQDYPDMQKMGSRRKKIFLTYKTADAISQEVLDPAELDVFEELGKIVERAATKPIADVAKQAGQARCNQCKIPLKTKGDVSFHLQTSGHTVYPLHEMGESEDCPVVEEKKPHTAEQTTGCDQCGCNKACGSERCPKCGHYHRTHTSSKKACGELPVVEGTNVGPGFSAEQQEPPKPAKDLAGPAGSEPIGIELNSDGTPKREEAGKTASGETGATGPEKPKEDSKPEQKEKSEPEESEKEESKPEEVDEQPLGPKVPSTPSKPQFGHGGHTITLANATQVALYKGELIGQMSDGMWENSSPRDHWRPMAHATVVVGHPGMDFSPARTYGFNRLLSYVGDRMLFLAKATKAYPNVEWGESGLAHAVEYMDGKTAEDFKEDWQKKYVEQLLAATGETDINQFLAKVNGQTYSMKDLRKDVRGIMSVINGAYQHHHSTVMASIRKEGRDRDETINYQGHTYRLTTWEERDRLNINLVDECCDKEIFNLWDDDARGLFEDGWVKPQSMLSDLVEYADHLGMLDNEPTPGSPSEVEASSERSRTAARKHESELDRKYPSRRKYAEDAPSADSVLDDLFTDLGAAPLVDLPGESSGTSSEAENVPEPMKSNEPEETKAEPNPEKNFFEEKQAKRSKIADIMDLLESGTHFGSMYVKGNSVAEDLAQAESEITFDKAEMADSPEATKTVEPEHFASSENHTFEPHKDQTENSKCKRCGKSYNDPIHSSDKYKKGSEGRHDDVPVSEGKVSVEKQPTSELNDGPPEAHDVPPQVDNKVASRKFAFSIEDVFPKTAEDKSLKIDLTKPSREYSYTAEDVFPDEDDVDIFENADYLSYAKELAHMIVEANPEGGYESMVADYAQAAGLDGDLLMDAVTHVLGRSWPDDQDDVRNKEGSEKTAEFDNLQILQNQERYLQDTLQRLSQGGMHAQERDRCRRQLEQVQKAISNLNEEKSFSQTAAEEDEEEDKSPSVSPGAVMDVMDALSAPEEAIAPAVEALGGLAVLAGEDIIPESMVQEGEDICEKCGERPATHEGIEEINSEMGHKQYGSIKLCDECDRPADWGYDPDSINKLRKENPKEYLD